MQSKILSTDAAYNNEDRQIMITQAHIGTQCQINQKLSNHFSRVSKLCTLYTWKKHVAHEPINILVLAQVCSDMFKDQKRHKNSYLSKKLHLFKFFSLVRNKASRAVAVDATVAKFLSVLKSVGTCGFEAKYLDSRSSGDMSASFGQKRDQPSMDLKIISFILSVQSLSQHHQKSGLNMQYRNKELFTFKTFIPGVALKLFLSQCPTRTSEDFPQSLGFNSAIPAS